MQQIPTARKKHSRNRKILRARNRRNHKKANGSKGIMGSTIVDFMELP